MDLYKETPYGRITISEKVFGEIILSILDEEEFKDKIWAANKRGKLIHQDRAFAESDAASALNIERDKDGRITVGLSLAVKFGHSIEELTDSLAETLRELIVKHDGKGPSKISLEIIGVKGRKLVPRNMEIVKEYDY